MAADLGKWSTDQPRDKDGKWSGGAGGGKDSEGNPFDYRPYEGQMSRGEARREDKMHPSELGMRRSEDPAAYDKQLANWKAHNPGKPEPKGPGVGHQLLNSFLAFFNPGTDRVS